MTALRRLRDRARALPPRSADLLLAAVVAVDGVLELTLTPGARLGAHGAVVVALMAAAVLVRRRVPFAALVLVFAGLIVGGRVEEVSEETIGPFIVLLAVLVSVGGRLEGRRFPAALALAVALALVAALSDTYPNRAEDFAFGLVLIAVAPLSLGRFLRRRSQLTQVLRETAASLERDRAQRARTAVAEERTRIAAELHDAVAHALSGMVIQASAAERLAVADPERAREALGAVEDSGREALDEMRRMLGVLRREDAEIALDPQPGLGQLAALARRSREAGLPVEVEVEGNVAALAPGVDLTAYRVVQEALYGAVQGDARTARVEVRYGHDRLDIRVDDDGGERGRGAALLGVRERLTIYGGELVVDGRTGAGHAVRARIPIGAAA